MSSSRLVHDLNMRLSPPQRFMSALKRGVREGNWTGKAAAAGMSICLILSDALALTVAAFGGLGAVWGFGAEEAGGAVLYFQLLPVLGLFTCTYAGVGLYPLMSGYPWAALGPVKELKHVTIATGLVLLVLGALTALAYGNQALPYLVLLIGGALAWILVPCGRATIRGLLCRSCWWGRPVMVFGAEGAGERAVERLRREPELGLRPVAVVDRHASRRDAIDGVPVLEHPDEARLLAHRRRIRHALVATPDARSTSSVDHGLALSRDVFPHLLVADEPLNACDLWESRRTLEFRVPSRPSLLRPTARWFKRIFELTVTGVGFLIAGPMIAVIGALIRLESRGPVFFVQKRPGLNGKPFKIYKFRTMYDDAHRRLNHLPPALRREFETYGKIANDPRITRVGRWLRKTSMDELPQLFNVLRGELNLVGPRAYLKSQLSQMNGHKDVVFQIPPGVTGIWQVSGRSTVSFEQRMAMDAHYVRNWSFWLDLYILGRTVLVVLGGRGAH